MDRVWPFFRWLERMRLARFTAATLTPLRCAMLHRLSPEPTRTRFERLARPWLVDLVDRDDLELLARAIREERWVEECFCGLPSIRATRVSTAAVSRSAGTVVVSGPAPRLARYCK